MPKLLKPQHPPMTTRTYCAAAAKRQVSDDLSQAKRATPPTTLDATE